jgi:polyhydroxyalkanoate synthesis regulator phasin
MNPQMMQMMGTFQSLLSLDKQDGLSITKDEAAKLLPVVQDIVSAGQMSDDQSRKLRDPLTDDQRKYLDSFADKMKQRMENRGGSGGKQANGNGAQKQANSSAVNSGNGTGGNGGISTNGGGSGGNDAGGSGGTGANNGIAGNGGTGANKGAAGSGNGAMGGSGSHGQSRAKNGSGGQGAGNRNIGQQLIDLLQSKTK